MNVYDAIVLPADFLVWYFWYRNSRIWMDLTPVPYMALVIGLMFGAVTLIDMIAGRLGNAIGEAILTTLWLWLFLKKRPPRKRRKREARTKVVIMGHRLGVMPT